MKVTGGVTTIAMIGAAETAETTETGDAAMTIVMMIGTDEEAGTTEIRKRR